MSFNIRNLLTTPTLVGALTLALGTAPAAYADPVEIIFNNFLPPNFAAFRDAIRPWAVEASAASNGTMSITIPTSSMAPFPRLWDIVQDRVVDMGIVPLAINDANVALPGLLYIPMIGNESSAVTGRALWETHVEHLAAAGEFESQDLIPLSFFVIGGNQFFSRERALDDIGDFAGLKVRGEGREPLEMIAALGAAPMGAPGVQSFELLSNGVIDVSMNPFGPAMNLGLAGYAAQVLTVPGGFFRPGFAIVINRDAFEELPEEAQRVLVETSGAALAERIGAVMDAEDVVGRQAFVDAGATVTSAPDALIDEIRARTAFVEERWLETAARLGVDGPAAISAFRAVTHSAE